jgi:predicted nucleic acid-binding protein
MTAVVDASALVAALVDSGPVGQWAEGLVFIGAVAGPHLLPVETANVLRRVVAAGDVSDDVATLAHADLLDLGVELFPYETFAERIWELRHNLTAYDAWYVALAEALDAPLVTADRRLSHAPGLRCEILLPPIPETA